MVRKIVMRLLVVGGGVAAVVQAAPQAHLPRLEAANPPGSPVAVTAVGTFDKPISSPSDLRLKFRVRNVSKSAVHSIEVEASVYSPNGQFKGLHGFTLKGLLKPKQESFFLRKTGQLQVEPSDRVVLEPVRVLTSKGLWEAEPGPGHPGPPR
jgi:hypothetical protein